MLIKITNRFSVAIAIAMATVLYSNGSAKCIDNETKQSLSKGIANSIDQYDKMSERITETSSWSIVPPDTSKESQPKGFVSQKQEITLVRDGKNYLIVSEATLMHDSSIVRTTTSRNTDYSFKLDDSKIRGVYKIETMTFPPNTIIMPQPQHILKNAIQGFDEIKYAIDELYGNRIVSVEKVGNDSLLVKTKFRITGESVDSTTDFLIATLPVFHIVKVIRKNPSNLAEVNITYGRQIENLPVPTIAIDKTTILVAFATSSITTHTLKDIYITNEQKLAFYLSHYGLPEPPGVVAPPSRTGYMMYLYIAIPVFAAVGLFFAYIRRRYFPRAVALPPAGTVGS